MLVLEFQNEREKGQVVLEHSGEMCICRLSSIKACFL